MNDRERSKVNEKLEILFLVSIAQKLSLQIIDLWIKLQIIENN